MDEATLALHRGIVNWYSETAMHKQKILLAPILFVLFTAPSFSQDQTNQAVSTPQDQVSYHAAMARQYLGEQRPDLAIPELQAVIALDPKNVDAHANLGVLEYFANKYSDAIPELREALTEQPDLWKIQGLLGLSEAKTNQNEASRNDLALAFPHLDEKKFKVEVGEALINNYASTQDLDKAAEISSALTKLEPTNPNMLYTSYRLYSDLADQAMIAMAMAAPKSAQLHQMMAHQLARRGDTSAAIANEREALKINPNLSGVHFEIAEMLRASTDAQIQAQAEGEYKAALAQNPHDDMSELRLGEIDAKRGDLKDAQVYYERIIAMQPNNAEAYIDLAKVFSSLNQPEKAKKALKQAIQTDPTNSVAHYRLSTIDRQQGHTEDAKRELAEYLKYKNMKESLQKTFHEMKVNAGAAVDDDKDATK